MGFAALLPLAACGGGGVDPSVDVDSRPPVQVNANASPNAVAAWSAVAAATVNGSGAAAVTPEEQRPNHVLDVATVHLAIYDALMAIDGTHKPFASPEQSPQAGASADAAVAAAAYGALKAMFPSRAALYQAAYDNALAPIPASESRSRGLAIGAAAAEAVIALRRNDGRANAVAPQCRVSSPWAPVA